MTTYTSPFTGDVVQPTDVSYYSLTFSTDQVLAWPGNIVPGSTDVPAARIMDCTAESAGLTITLPYGSQGSVGTDILFRNVGDEDFIVEDSSGDQSVTIAAGTARYFYLTDNSTEDGVYANFTYGAGTSIADAASLVGSGLTNQAGRLETSTDVVEVSVAPTLTEDSRALAYVWTSGSGNFDLPDPATIEAGWFIMIRNGGTGALTVTPYAGSTIDNASNVTFFPADSGIIVYDTDTDNFFTVGLAKPSSVIYNSATYDVDSIVGDSLSLVTSAPTIQTYVAFSGTRTTNLEVTLPAITQIYIINNQTGYSSYTIDFVLDGSIATPLSFADGVTAILLSDGNNLSVLSQGTTGVFLAADGSVGAPSFSFNSDTGVGLYLPGVNRLNAAANGVDVLELNAANLASVQIRANGEFNAELISGGTF